MQSAYSAGCPGSASWHWNVAFSPAPNLNEAAVPLIRPDGPAVIVVSGATVSGPIVNGAESAAWSDVVATVILLPPESAGLRALVIFSCTAVPAGIVRVLSRWQRTVRVDAVPLSQKPMSTPPTRTCELFAPGNVVPAGKVTLM